MVRRHCDVGCEDVLHLVQHYCLIHPVICLAAVEVGCWVGLKLLLHDPPRHFTLEHHHRGAHCAILRDRCSECRELGVVRRCADMNCLLAKDVKSLLGRHCKVDRSLIHVEDETPVVIHADNNTTHVGHVLHRAAARSEGLLMELRG